MMWKKLERKLYDEHDEEQFRTQRRRTQALVIIAIRMVTRGTSCFCAVTVSSHEEIKGTVTDLA